MEGGAAWAFGRSICSFKRGKIEASFFRCARRQCEEKDIKKKSGEKTG